MTRYDKIICILFACCIFIYSCKNEEVSPEIETPIVLPALPENATAYLTISNKDTTYELVNGEDNTVFYSTIATVPENSIIVPYYGSSVTSDTSLLIFTIAYIRSANTRNELLKELTKRNGDIAFEEIANDIVIERESGFLLEISELAYPNGPGISFSTTKTDQPDDSFFLVNNYYAGQSEYTIWLEGSFSLIIQQTNNSLKKVEGSFLLELPTCCFNQQ